MPSGDKGAGGGVKNMLKLPEYIFNFDPEKYDFWEIYESINKYYPIGIPKDDTGFYRTYKGQKELAKLLDENIHNEKNFKIRWGNFDSILKKITNLKIVGTTYGQLPSFSSYVIIKTSKYKDVTRFKEVHYFVSLLGNFYTIIGQDRNEVIENKKRFLTINSLIVSPEGEYLSVFEILSEQIEKQFKNFRFVPFWICKQKIVGLNTGDSIQIKDSVFDGLFGGNHVELDNRVLGNEFYKSEDWIIPGYVDNGSHWTIYPPGYTTDDTHSAE